MKTLILTVFALLTIPFSAWADDIAPMPTLGVTPGDAAPLRETEKDRLVQSADNMMLYLNDGQTIELSGIWLPEGEGFQWSNQEMTAQKFLGNLFDKPDDRAVILYQTQISGKGRVNRLGHELAHIVRKNDNVWVQGALLANGLAEAWPTPSNPELATKMYAIEDQARAAGRGLWSKDSPYRLVQADEKNIRLDRFAVVEGTVKKAETVNNQTYLNFGEDWKEDFTLGITNPVKQLLARNGIDITKLGGQRIRVRGWLRYYNGPYMELEDPVALQTLDQAQHNNIVSGSPQLSITDSHKVRAAPVTNSVGEQKKIVP
jgi:micrococcal nuclease